MKPLRLIICSCITGCLLFGCATQSDVRILEDRIIALERRNLELQQQTAEAVNAKRQIRSQLDEKEQALRDQSAGISATTDELKSDIQVLNGRIDELNYRMAQKLSELKAVEQRIEQAERKLDIETPPRQSPQPYSPPPASNTGASGNEYMEMPEQAEQPAAALPASDTADESRLYTQGRQSFENGDYAGAREKFQMLIRQYPGKKYADSAQFWIGESFYKERDYEQAILEYQTVIEKYPKGNKVRGALLKQGFAFYNMGDTNNARLILQDLIERYPNSSEAKIARQKLNNL